MDEVKKNKKKTKTSLAHINEIQMTCKEHCHTTDTYLQIFYYVT